MSLSASLRMDFHVAKMAVEPVFPIVRNRSFIAHCYHPFAVNVRGTLPRGSHPTSYDWLVAVHAFISNISLHMHPIAAAPLSVMQFATDVTSDTP